MNIYIPHLNNVTNYNYFGTLLDFVSMFWFEYCRENDNFRCDVFEIGMWTKLRVGPGRPPPKSGPDYAAPFYRNRSYAVTKSAWNGNDRSHS